MTQFCAAVPRFEFDTVLTGVHAHAREIYRGGAALSQTSASAAWLHGLFNNFPLLQALSLLSHQSQFTPLSLLHRLALAQPLLSSFSYFFFFLVGEC